MTVLRFVAGIALLLLNGFFVSIEFALTRLRQFDESDMEGDSGLELAWHMTEQLEIYLTACQVGITVTSILLGVVFEPAVSALVHPLTAQIGLGATATAWVSVILAVGLIQFMHTVWGEQSPTYLGVEKPLVVASWGALPLYIWAYVSYPWIYIGDHASKATLKVFGVELTRSWTHDDAGDLMGQIGEILHDSALEEEEKGEILNAIESTQQPVGDVIVPAKDVVSIRADASVDDAIEVVRNNRKYTRFPLIGDDLRDCRGILYARELLNELEALRSGETPLEELASPAFFLESDTSINEAVDQFQMAEQELAIVVEDGEAIGIATDSHLFEALVGELQDPFD